MIDRPALREPKLHFETAHRPASIFFEDENEREFILPWSDFETAQRYPDNPEIIRMEMALFVVAIYGLNLKPLQRAIAENSVLYLKAFPGLVGDRECDRDTFVTAIHFFPRQKAAKPRSKKDSGTAREPDFPI